MTPEQVIEYYGQGSQVKTAELLNVSRQVVNNWKRRKRIPLAWQIYISHKSQLKLDGKPSVKPNGAR